MEVRETMETMETIVLKRETVNKILSYLGGKPYAEAVPVIGAMREDFKLLNVKEDGNLPSAM
jgi:Ni,Fe-hydrogenase III large subunit